MVSSKCDELDVRGIQHKGYFAAITNLKSYMDANLELLLNPELVNDLFKANWLPSPPSWGEAGEFTDYLADEGHGALLPYEINSYNRTDLQGIRYCF